MRLFFGLVCPLVLTGCILADDMGLGKTLQGIALLWTLLHSGHESLGGISLGLPALLLSPTLPVQQLPSLSRSTLSVAHIPPPPLLLAPFLNAGKPIAKRVIIVCPTSLVNNWDSECDKWLKGRVRTLPLCESSRSDVIQGITIFLSPSNIHQVRKPLRSLPPLPHLFS